MNEEKVVKNGDDENIKNNKGKGVVNGDGFTEVSYKKVTGSSNGEGTSKSKEGYTQSNNQRYNGKNGNQNKGNSSKGNNGYRGGNGRGQNRNWNNKGISHWNLEKNRSYEKFANGQNLVGSQGIKENKMQGYVIKKDNKKEEGNKSLESKNNTDDGLSNKNKFEILGVIEEEVMDRMEEDAKGEKVVIHQKEECVGSSIDVNEIMNN